MRLSDGMLYVFKRWDEYRGDKPHFERVTFSRRTYWNDFVEGLKTEVPRNADVA